MMTCDDIVVGVCKPWLTNENFLLSLENKEKNMETLFLSTNSPSPPLSFFLVIFPSLNPKTLLTKNFPLCLTIFLLS